ncbi:MAG: HAMP domain-containing protein, partial [Desulfobacteraceae bacterium]|nr:HAMP domain-containing protein [Desulfobacteraceae bacterium]
MKWFHDLKIGTKLLLSFAFIALIGALTSFEGSVKLRQIDANYSVLIENTTMPLGEIGKTAVAFQEIQSVLQDVILDKDQQEIRAHIDELKHIDKMLKESLARLGKSSAVREIRKEFEALNTALSRFETAKDRILSLLLELKNDEALDVLRKEALAHASIIRKSIGALMEDRIAYAARQSDTNTAETHASVGFIYAVSIAGVAFALLLGFFLSRTISRPLKDLSAAVDKVSGGDVSVSVAVRSRDEVGMLSQAFGNMIENIKSVSASVGSIAAGDLNLEVQVRSERDLLGKSLQSMLKMVKGLIGENDRLIGAIREGRLEVRGDAARYQGAWGDLVGGVNRLVEAFVVPMNVTADYMDRIGRGDIPPKITEEYSGDFNKIKNSLNSCITNVNGLVADAEMLARAAVQGKLATRADAGRHPGDFGKIVEGVNHTLDAVIGPLNVAADYVDRISRGDIPPKIADSYNGDFNQVKNNLNNCIDAVNELVADANMLARAAVEGKLSTRADASKHTGDYRKI